MKVYSVMWYKNIKAPQAKQSSIYIQYLTTQEGILED